MPLPGGLSRNSLTRPGRSLSPVTTWCFLPSRKQADGNDQLPICVSLRIAWVEPEQGALLWELVRREIPIDGREALSQFCSVAPVAAIAKRAEPLEAVGLADDGARPHHLASLASGVARGTDFI